MSKSHIERKLYHISTIVQSLYIMTVLDFINYRDACFVSLLLFSTNILTTSYLMNNLRFMVVSLVVYAFQRVLLLI